MIQRQNAITEQLLAEHSNTVVPPHVAQGFGGATDHFEGGIGTKALYQLGQLEEELAQRSTDSMEGDGAQSDFTSQLILAQGVIVIPSLGRGVLQSGSSFVSGLRQHAPKGSPNMVNPEIARGLIPPSSLFGGNSFQHWGRGIVSWGTGAKEALARIGTLTKDQILKLGITKEQAQAGLEFYKNEMLRNPGNPTAAARVKLMEHILSLLN